MTSGKWFSMVFLQLGRLELTFITVSIAVNPEHN
jgi:hypothetical protein